jgi:hypothetical protein
LFSAGGAGTIAHPVEGLAWKLLALPAGSRLDSEQPDIFLPRHCRAVESVHGSTSSMNGINQQFAQQRRNTMLYKNFSPLLPLRSVSA